MGIDAVLALAIVAGAVFWLVRYYVRRFRAMRRPDRPHESKPTPITFAPRDRDSDPGTSQDG